MWITCPANTLSPQGKSQLYIFEDNEAVIKMIINGRSPTMRHVSRTDRVALDWLCRQYSIWNPKSKSTMLTPKTTSLACLAEGEVSRKMNGSNLLSFVKKKGVSRCISCSHFSDFLSNDPIGKQSAMSKRGQEATSFR